jgi:transaldolase/glucose-6-phosphate isomerase
MNTAGISTTIASTSLRTLRELGQSIWLDHIQRNLLRSGKFGRLVAGKGVTGVTANPSIFEKAILGSTDYDDAIRTMARRDGCEAKEAYETLAIADIRDAADVLRPIYDQTQGWDGFASLEVSPLLAYDTHGTIQEARRLWAAIGRENVMIKVPGTPEGVPAIATLTEDGINVNVTLLFSVAAYQAAAEAYLAGLEARTARGGDIRRVTSVASFFVSRIDTAIDGLIANQLQNSASADERAPLQHVRGRVAIANAKLAYEWYEELIRTNRWRSMADRGARPQRLLWASTSTKNPQYREVRYVEELIGSDTINTMTPATLDAFSAHGRARASLAENRMGAHATMSALARTGIPLDAVTTRLLEEGIGSFIEAFETLLEAIRQKLDASKVAPETHPG